MKHGLLLSLPALPSVPSVSAVPSVLRVFQLYQAFGEIFGIEGRKKVSHCRAEKGKDIVRCVAMKELSYKCSNISEVTGFVDPPPLPPSSSLSLLSNLKPIIIRPPKLHRMMYSSFPTSWCTLNDTSL